LARFAWRVRGLEERTTLKEIKARHKTLVKRYHLDTGNTNEPEMIQKVNAAYKIVLDYVAVYRRLYLLFNDPKKLGWTG